MDNIADALCILKNGCMAKLNFVDILRGNKMILEICKILKRDGFIERYITRYLHGQVQIRVFLKFSEKGKPFIQGVKRVSSPGRRVYLMKSKLPYVRSGLGIAIVSTNKGVMKAQQAKALGVGGELICSVW